MDALLSENSILELKVKHDKMLKDGCHNNSHAPDILKILGGIDTILSHYLSCSNSLNTSQISEINDILSNATSQHAEHSITKHFDLSYLSKPSKSINASKPASRFEWSVSNIRGSKYYFSITNTLLHSTNIFGANFGVKIFNMVYSQIIGFVVFLMLIYSITSAIFYVVIGKPFIFHLLDLISLTMYAIYLTFLLLSINKTAFKLILKSFEFWFKLLYVICFVILEIMTANPRGGALGDLYMQAVDYMKYIVWILAIVAFSSVDGLQLHTLIKKVLGLGYVMFFVVITIERMYDAVNSEPDEYSIHIWGKDCVIPLKSWISSVSRVLTIFLIKQTYCMVFREDKTTLIRTACIVYWVH
eukprot:16445_1